MDASIFYMYMVLYQGENKRLDTRVLYPSILLHIWPNLVDCPTKTNLELILEIIFHQQSFAAS